MIIAVLNFTILTFFFSSFVSPQLSPIQNWWKVVMLSRMFLLRLFRQTFHSNFFLSTVLITIPKMVFIIVIIVIIAIIITIIIIMITIYCNIIVHLVSFSVCEGELIGRKNDQNRTINENCRSLYFLVTAFSKLFIIACFLFCF